MGHRASLGRPRAGADGSRWSPRWRGGVARPPRRGERRSFPLDLRLRTRRTDLARDARRRRRARSRLHRRGPRGRTFGDAGDARTRDPPGRDRPPTQPRRARQPAAPPTRRRRCPVARDSRRGRGLRLSAGRVPETARRDRIRPAAPREAASPGQGTRPLADVLALVEPDPRVRDEACRARSDRRSRREARRDRDRDPASRRRALGSHAPPRRAAPTAVRAHRDRAVAW